MSQFAKMFGNRYSPSPFPELRWSDADAPPEKSDEAKRIIAHVQDQLRQPTPPAGRIPRVIPSRRR